MMAPQCPCEQDVITAILAGRWPDQCDDVLRAHAAQCEICRDLVDVVSLLRDERHRVAEGVSVPSAGQVWWRAAIRARLESRQTVSRPLTWMFGTAAACVIGLAVAFVGLLWPSVQQADWSSVQGAWVNVRSSVAVLDVSQAGPIFASVVRTGVWLALGAVTCIGLASLAVYFALRDE